MSFRIIKNKSIHLLQDFNIPFTIIPWVVAIHVVSTDVSARVQLWFVKCHDMVGDVAIMIS